MKITGAINVFQRIVFVLIVGLYEYTYSAQDYALVTAPVIDAIIKPSDELSFNEHFYANLSCYIEEGLLSPFRAHQLLFNEIVKVIGENEHELHVELLNAVYATKQNDALPCTYWCLKKNVMMLSGEKYEQIKHYLPTPFYANKIDTNECNDVTLKEPWYALPHHVWYSAGTRFVRDTSSDTQDEYGIYLLNPNSLIVEKALIPKDNVYMPSGGSPQARRKDFVDILKGWCVFDKNDKNEEIPYIWGGCSFVEMYQPGFQLVPLSNQLFWERPKKNKMGHAGFDCSGIVFRAAQIVGLPYWFRNTTTLKKNLRPKKINEPLNEGDLLWFPGHVVIVADIPNNLIVEASGYAVGYGKVQMIRLEDSFKNIESFDQLVNLYHTKDRRLIRLNNKGGVFAEIGEFEILKMISND